MAIKAEEKECKNIQPSWKEVCIKDVCESITDCVNKTAPTVEYPTPYKMIRTNNVRNGQIDLTDVKYVTKEIFEIWTRRIIPKRGDIILTREAPLGEVGMIKADDHIFLGQRLMQYRANPCYMDNRFLLYAFQDRTLQEQVRLLGSGATVEHMRVPDAEKLIIQLPPLPEQTAIATALSDVDALITSLDKLIAKKRDIKQATMQQLLTGKMRLPGFSGEWEVKRLEEIAEISMGSTPSRRNQAYWGRGYKWLSIADLKSKHVFETKEEITSLAISSMNRIPKNTLVMSFKLTIGRLAFTGCDMYSNEAICSFTRVRADGEYLYYVLGQTDFSLYGKQAVKGYTLNTDSLKSVEILCPEISEQRAIATILSDMDAEIAALEQKRAKTRMLKQGMMQELLTGKTRLV